MRISVVIPTLNAAARLPACLAALGAAVVHEIIIVDAGSGDGTLAQAHGHGAVVLQAPAGRGQQLAAGAAAAQADWLLFLHADSVLGAGWPAAAAAAVPGKAGYFRLRFASGRPAARRLEWLAAWRCRWLALPYGDQGLLIHRSLLAAIGGVPRLPLMEDVALARRLGRRRLQALNATATTCAARYEAAGYLRRSLHNLGCLTLYFLGVSPARIKRLYG